jgi:16S rRNA G966 N2-methylase RsmD
MPLGGFVYADPPYPKSIGDSFAAPYEDAEQKARAHGEK